MYKRTGKDPSSIRLEHSVKMEDSKHHQREMFTDLAFVDQYGNGNTPSRRHSTSPTFYHSERFYDGHFEDNLLVIKSSSSNLTNKFNVFKACSNENLLLLPGYHQKQKRKSVMFPLTIQDQNSSRNGAESVYSGTLHFSPISRNHSDSESSLTEDKMMNKMTGEIMKTDEYHVYCLINPICQKRHPSLKKLADIFLSQFLQKL